jgi:hypothetical protein
VHTLNNDGSAINYLLFYFILAIGVMKQFFYSTKL